MVCEASRRNICGLTPPSGRRTTSRERGRWRSSALIEGSGTGLLSFAQADRSDPSFTLDLRLIQPISDGYSFYGDLYNATDNRVVDSYVVRGRSFFVGARAVF